MLIAIAAVLLALGGDLTTPAAQLDDSLAKNPASIPEVMRALGNAFMSDDATQRARTEELLLALVAHRAQRPDADVRTVASFAMIDPARFMEDRAFRARVSAFLPRALNGNVSRSVRDECLRYLNKFARIDFELAERIAQRDSAAKRIAFPSSLQMPDDISGPIETSIYSLTSQFFTRDDAQAFIDAVHASAPKRRIVVLSDMKFKNADVVDTYARAYTPWPRDPFTVARNGAGVVLINRPNLQPQREEDANMVRALMPEVDASWTVASIPFHNGHVLLTPKNAWISIHTVEIRALQILKLDRVPVETFDKKEGIEAYLGAARQAVKELESLYGRPVRFVHPLTADAELMRRLGGGAGFDLDSVMTLLPRADGSLVALVGDTSHGEKIARDADWSPYGVKGDVAAAQKAPKVVALSIYLDTIASHLAANGVVVRRLPLIHVPASFVADAPKDFLVTWNNVVLETRGSERRAEGFASRLAEGDKLARDTFAAAGYKLELFPPLMRSVVLSGGYRCASNHVRPR